MMQKLSIFIFITAIIGILSACQSLSETDINAAKHLRLATPFRIQHLDPLKSGHYFLVEFGIAELPAKLDSDGKIKPWLLESFEQIDSLNWKLKLRPNIKFQNGKSLTPEIFARVMNRNLERSPETKSVIGDAVAKVSGNEIIFSTKYPTPTVPSALADETVFPIYDVETVEAVGDDSLKLVDKGVYTGAYKIISLNEREMNLARNESYWQGIPNFENVSIIFVADPQARILAVQNNEVDISLYPQMQNKQMLEGRSDASFNLSDKSVGGPSLFFNLKNSPFNEQNLRRAVSLGLNYESIANDTMDGVYKPANGFYPPEFAWAKQNQKTDIEQAKQLLEASGWQLKNGKIRNNNGTPLTAELIIYPQQADFAAFATAIQAQLEKIGFDIKIRQVDDINSEIKSSKTWNLAIIGSGTVSTGGSPDAVLLRYFLSGSEENRFGIKDENLDEKIKLLNRTMVDNERNRILGEIQEIIVAEKTYLVRLGFTRARAIVGKKFKNYKPSPQLFHLTFETRAD